MDGATDDWAGLLASGSDGDATDAPLAVMETGLESIFQSDSVGRLQLEPDLSASIVTTWEGLEEAHEPAQSPATTFLDQEKDHCAVERRERQRQLSARRKRTHRERVKNELGALTAQVEALERELRRLEAARAAADPTTDCNGLAEEWRKLAVRNHKRRRAAERLNEQLKHKIARSSALLGDFSRVPSSFTWPLDQLPADQSSSRYSKLHEDSLLVSFAQELEAVYARTDDAIGCRFASEPEEQWSRSVSRRWDRESQKELFELVDSFVLPFGYSKASQALWESMGQVYETDSGLLNSEAIGCPDNTFAVHFRIYGSTSPGSSMSCSFVTRRYVESERTVVVWRALSEGLEGSMAGVATDETGWSILRSVPSDACFSVDGEGGTVMDTFVLMTPLVSDATKRRGRAQDFESFVSRVISTVSEDGDAIARLMDGLLLTQAPSESTPAITMQ